MAPSVNRVFLTGWAGRDPDLIYLPGGRALARFTMATHERTREGTRTCWHRVVVYGYEAEAVREKLRKGQPVVVVGKLRTRKWEVDGQVRSATEVEAFQVEFFGGMRHYKHDSTAALETSDAG